MRRNWLWLSLLCVVVVVAAWYVTTAAVQIVHYARLDQRTPLLLSEWSVEKVGSDKFALHVSYTYKVEGTLYEAEETLEARDYRNQRTAVAASERARGESWSAWYSSSDPAISAIEKRFPAKSLVYANIVLALLAYLIFLGWYSRHRSSVDNF